MPENQTAWNSDNQGIKEIVNQTNQTGRRESGSQVGGENPWQGHGPRGQSSLKGLPGEAGSWLREPVAGWWTAWVGLAERTHW